MIDAKVYISNAGTTKHNAEIISKKLCFLFNPVVLIIKYTNLFPIHKLYPI